MLAQIYCNLACNPEPESGVASVEHWIAVETFEHAQSIKLKRNILLGAAKKRNLSSKTINTLSELIKIAQKLYNDTRITAAHGRWMVSPSYPGALVYMQNVGNSGKALIYDAAELSEDLQRLTDLGGELSKLLGHVIIPELKSKSR